MTSRVKIGVWACLAGLLAGAGGIALEILAWSDLFSLPSGATIRPLHMGRAYLTFEIEFWVAVIGLPLSVLGLILAKGKRKYGILAVLACLAPFPVGLCVYDLAVGLRGLVVD